MITYFLFSFILLTNLSWNKIHEHESADNCCSVSVSQLINRNQWEMLASSPADNILFTEILKV